MKCPHCEKEVLDGEDVVYQVGMLLKVGKLSNVTVRDVHQVEVHTMAHKPKEGQAVHKDCFFANMNKHGIKGSMKLRPFTNNK